MNLNYKLIATDMDDTLLNKDQEISIENEESIIDVQKKRGNICTCKWKT